MSSGACQSLIDSSAGKCYLNATFLCDVDFYCYLDIVQYNLTFNGQGINSDQVSK